MLLLGAALAHTPHDTTTFLAIDEDGRLLSALSRTPELAVLRSEDGWRWERERWLGQIPTDGAWLDGEPVVVDDSEGLRFVEVLDGELWAAGEAGLFVDGEQLSDQTVVALAAPCYVTTERAVCGEEREVGGLQVVDIAWDEERVLLATDGDGLLEWDGGWQRVDGPGDRIACVDLIDGVVHAAEFADVLWVDGVSSEPFPETEEGPGNPPDGRHYFGFEQAPDGATWLVSWEGLLRTEDGSSWEERPVITPEVHRSVAIDDAGRWLLGSYGGGVVRFDPATGESEALSAGSPAGFVRQVEAGDRAWFTEKGQLWRQDSPLWTRLELSAEDIAVDGAAILVGGEDGVHRSEDGEVFVRLLDEDTDHVALEGTTWAIVTAAGALLLDGEVVAEGLEGVNDLALEDGEPVLSTRDGLWRGGVLEHEGQWVEAWEEGVALLDEGDLATDLAVAEVVLRSTHQGVFDADGVLVSNLLVVDGGHPGWSGEAEVLTDTDCLRLTRHVVPAGARRVLPFHGEGLKLRGSGELLLDGEPIGACATFEPGFHRLEVVGPAEVDAVELYLGEGWQDLDCSEPDPPPRSRCDGCGSGAAALLLLPALLRRRDRLGP